MRISTGTSIAILELVIVAVFLWQMHRGGLYLMSPETFQESMVHEQFVAYLEGFSAGVSRCIIPNMEGDHGQNQVVPK